MPAIEIKNLSKKFGNFSAVDDLSFFVEENKIFGFLGPNGAGKTTTIRMMVGLSKISSGDIEICGQKVEFGKIDTNSIFGYLPEQPALYHWMTGIEYLNFIADIFQIENKKKTIERLLNLVDLNTAGKKRIGTYSNGMKQRLGITQALINDPKVLIMDEPVSALDPIGRREVLNIIEDLKKDKTIFMSTHILSDVDKICDNIAIINKGKLAALSSLSDLKEKYAKPILEVEFAVDPGELVNKLQGENWVKKVDKSGNHLKIWPIDLNVIESNVPIKFFAENGPSILKYGQILPELEDIFMETIGGKHE